MENKKFQNWCAHKKNAHFQPKKRIERTLNADFSFVSALTSDSAKKTFSFSMLVVAIRQTASQISKQRKDDAIELQNASLYNCKCAFSSVFNILLFILTVVATGGTDDSEMGLKLFSKNLLGCSRLFFLFSPKSIRLGCNFGRRSFKNAGNLCARLQPQKFCCSVLYIVRRMDAIVRSDPDEVFFSRRTLLEGYFL